MDRLDFSKDLNTFSYMYKNKNSDIFIINDESQKRIFLSRLYYSLYHRLLTELPKIKELSGPGGHETVYITLEKQVRHGDHYQKLFAHFTDLRDLGVWADYNVEESLETDTNFTVLFQKTFRFINSSKLIA